MKKNTKFLILFLGVVISIIVIFLITNNIKRKSKLDGYPTYNNNQNELSNEDIKGEQNSMIDEVTKINININGTDFTATLEDNDTTKEFIKRLPLEVTMSELNGNEKYYYFDNSLPSNPSKISQINRGDLMLYGKDCLVLFYETFTTSYTYTRVGKIDNSSLLKESVGKGSIKVSITQ